MLRFLHTADWQIGRQFGRFDADDGAMLANARLDAVRRIADLAAERAVDAVLVAGDIFDAQTISDKLMRRTFQAISAFDGYWFLLPGNHDAALADGVWARARAANLLTPRIVLLDRPEPFINQAGGYIILPAPLTQRQASNDLTEWFDRTPHQDGMLFIGMAHGSVADRLPEAAVAPNPIAPDRASRAALDYLALGDWHGCLQIDERTWYSGTPEADRFRSNEPGFVLEVQLAAPGALPNVTRHRTGQLQWQRVDAALNTTVDAGETLEQLCQPLGSDAVVRLTLSGVLNWGQTVRVRKLVDAVRASVAALSLDDTALSLLPDDSELSTAPGYLGAVLTDLRGEVNAQSEPDPVLQHALAILSEAVLSVKAGQDMS